MSAHAPTDRGPCILCWNCKELTPYRDDRCVSCGAQFAGSTGGAYGSRSSSGSSRRVSRSVPLVNGDLASARRSLRELFEDLQRVHDVASNVQDRDEETTVTLFQCPSCGRFVSEASTACACGVRFSPDETPCPTCGAVLPNFGAACPTCRMRDLMYLCPTCGSEVTEDDRRCSCGAIFEA
jgi:predicted RNA-binding Zn-ribbon protein involved in translation (DUF1610 family)